MKGKIGKEKMLARLVRKWTRIISGLKKGEWETWPEYHTRCEGVVKSLLEERDKIERKYK